MFWIYGVYLSSTKFAVRLWNSVRMWQAGAWSIWAGGGVVGSPKSQKAKKPKKGQKQAKQGQSDPKTEG